MHASGERGFSLVELFPVVAMIGSPSAPRPAGRRRAPRYARPLNAVRCLFGSRRHGYTLIEILLVIAMLGILAALAMPALFRAKQSGNEAAAIGSLRTIVKAQYLYASSCGDGYFAPSLKVLGQAPPVGMPFVGQDLATADVVVKSGYTITIGSTSGAAAEAAASCNGLSAGLGVRAFWATATPTPNAGARAYGVNSVGAIYFAVQTLPLAMTDTAVPAGARPIPE